MGGGGSKRQPHTLLKETLCDHDDAINCMAVSEDGSLIATGSDDKTVRMWTARSDDTDCLGILKGHTQYVTCVTIVDAFIITGSADCTVRKWDATTCDCLSVYEGHNGRIIRLICNGEFIFSTSNDQTAKAWLFDPPDDAGTDSDDEAEILGCLMTFEGHNLGISSIIYIPGEGSDTVSVKDAYLNPEDIVITGSADTSARSWSLATGKTLKIFRGHKGPVTSMATDPDGTILYTGSMDNTIRCWNISTSECVKIWSGHTGPVLSLNVVNKLIYSGSSDNTARCWVHNFDVPGITYRGHLHTVSYVKFHQGYLFTASGDACARAFDAKSGSLKAVFRGHTSAITCLCLLDNYLYTASSDKTLRVWDASRVTLESEEQMEALGDEEEVTANNELDKFEHKLNGYTNQEDVDLASKPDTLKPPSPSPRLRSRSPTPSGRSRLSLSPALSPRSRLSASPSRLSTRGSDGDSVAKLTQDLGV